MLFTLLRIDYGGREDYSGSYDQADVDFCGVFETEHDATEHMKRICVDESEEDYFEIYESQPNVGFSVGHADEVYQSRKRRASERVIEDARVAKVAEQEHTHAAEISAALSRLRVVIYKDASALDVEQIGTLEDLYTDYQWVISPSKNGDLVAKKKSLMKRVGWCWPRVCMFLKDDIRAAMHLEFSAMGCAVSD